jgi:Lon protease-like protein
MNEQEIPLFPLHTVLFPGGALPLRIFEARYLDMISNCMKQGTGFGVSLILEGSEVGEAALTYDIGTLAEIDYWHMRKDGILGVTIRGKEKFRILSRDIQPNQLTIAKVSYFPSEAEKPIPEKYASLAEILRHIIDQLGYPYIKLPRDYENASWVSARLAELLPLELEQKQLCLHLTDPIQRLNHLSMLVKDLGLS